MKHITGNLINAYFICKRKVWLYAHQINPDPFDEFLEVGRIISEGTYFRYKKEILLENIKIDLIKRNNGKVLIGEIKKSSKGLKAGIMQLAFYLYQLKNVGLSIEGELLIPKEKKRISIKLTEDMEKEIKYVIKEISRIIQNEIPPESLKNEYCKHCCYNEFCFAEITEW